MLESQLKKSYKYISLILIIILFILIIVDTILKSYSYLSLISSFLLAAFCCYLFIYIHYLYIKQLDKRKGILLIISPTLIKTVILFFLSYLCHVSMFLDIRYYIFGILAYPFHFLFLIMNNNLKK